MHNSLNVFCSRRRWIKRLVAPYLDDLAWFDIYPDLRFYYYPRDIRGPSHHFAYELGQGFENYEQVEKGEILSHLPPGGAFVDIGANIGLFSIYIAYHRKDCRLFSYEPESTAFNCLQHTVEHNRLDQISLFNTAIGKDSGEAKLYRSHLNDGGHSLFMNSADKSEESTQKVEIQKLDPPMRGNEPLKIDVLKIDVEGWEPDVLEGAHELISADRPVMMIECNNQDLCAGQSLYQVLDTKWGPALQVKEPGVETWRPWSEIKGLAEKKRQHRLLDNYFFRIS